jgi:oxygen-dependent protoporphyrinogen oxidase
MLRVAVVGGGITGLTAAYTLEQRARATGQPLAVTLFEADHRLGGKLRTDFVGDLLVEQGPDALFLRSPESLDLCEQIGLGAEMVRPSATHRGAHIVYGGRLHPLPAGMEGGIPRGLRQIARSGLLSPAGKLRAALEVAVPPGREEPDESVDGFVRRRFGAEVAERVAGPMLGGVYSTDPRDLSLRATLPHLAQAEQKHRSLLRAVWRSPARASAQPTPWRPSFVTPRRGVESLVDALAAALTDTTVRMNSAVESIREAPDGWLVRPDEGEPLLVGQVVVAVPGFRAAGLLAEAAPSAAAELSSLHYGSVVVVAVAYPPTADAHLPPGTGALAALGEPGLVAACSWTSRKWPHCAPGGELLLRCHLQEHRAPGLLALGDDEIVDAVGRELRALYGVHEAPLFGRVYRWPRAVPSFRVGHPQRMARLRDALAGSPGLHVAGAGYHGLGIPECIRQGRAVAEQVLAGTHPGAVVPVI